MNMDFGECFVAIEGVARFLCEPCAVKKGVVPHSDDVLTWDVGCAGWLAPILCEECRRSIPIICDGIPGGDTVRREYAERIPAGELEEEREGVLNLAASETTGTDELDDALSDFENAVRKDERTRLATFGASSGDPSRDAALRAAVRAALAYLLRCNRFLSEEERIAIHFKWRDGDKGTEGRDLFVRLRDLL